MNLSRIFGQGKPKSQTKEDYDQIAALATELKLTRPHRDYDEWDIVIHEDELHFVDKDDLVMADFSENIWLPVQFNGLTCRLQIDDLIADLLKTDDPNKIREVYLDWLTGDAKGPAFRYGNEIVLKLEFYKDIKNNNLKKKGKHGAKKKE